MNARQMYDSQGKPIKGDPRKDKLGRWKWPYKPFNPYGGDHAKVTQANTNEAIETALTILERSEIRDAVAKEPKG